MKLLSVSQHKSSSPGRSACAARLKAHIKMTPSTRGSLWPAQFKYCPSRWPLLYQRPNLHRGTASPHAVAGGTDAPRSHSGRHPELMQLVRSGMHRKSDMTTGVGSEAIADPTAAARAIEQPRPEEVDERYRRADYSDVFQFESRQAFTRCIAGGEPRMQLAEAALHVTAEDDAIASHSTVRFPVAAWMERIERLVDQLCRKDMRRAATATAAVAVTGRHGNPVAATEAEAVLRVTEHYLFEEVGFRMPEYGRSNLPPNSVVDHAGVWEDARLGYLHETLTRRLGHPATLGLLLGEVTTRLLERGMLPCAAAIDTRSYVLLPRAVPLPALTREIMFLRSSETTTTNTTTTEAAQDQTVTRANGGMSCSSSSSNSNTSSSGGGSSSGSITSLAGLNTCTSEVLVEMLRHLKRSYWPFPWDTGADAVYPAAVGSHGGFRSAAKAAMGDDMSAALAAIGKVAAWRLERGIWTSPGAGDLRRARAACERLVLLAGERYPEERRDLAVLLLHCGDVRAATLELRTYINAVSVPPGAASVPSRFSAAFKETSLAALPPAGRADPQVTSWNLESRGHGPDPFDLLLCRRLLEALEGAGVAGDTHASAEEGPTEPLGIESTLRAVPPWERPASSRDGTKRYLPLTW